MKATDERGESVTVPLFFAPYRCEVAHPVEVRIPRRNARGYGFCVSFSFNRLATVVKRLRQRANAVRIIPNTEKSLNKII